MIDYLIHILKSWSDVLPLPWFVFIGALVEEIIAPIPSPLVMTLAGSLAAAQNQNFLFLLFLAFVGMVGKTLGCYAIYLIAAKFEHVVTHRFGKLIGISQKQIDSLAKKFGKGWRDASVLFLLRAAPIMPTAPVSFVAGILRLDLKVYLVSSAAGVFVRNIFYLYLGFTSVDALERINKNLDSVETIGYVIVLGFIAWLVFYIYKKRREL